MSDVAPSDILQRAESLLPHDDGVIHYAGRVAYAMQLDRDRALAALVPALVTELKAALAENARLRMALDDA